MNVLNDQQSSFKERLQFYSTVFQNDFERLSRKCKSLWPIEAYTDTVTTLKNLGFVNPHKIILDYPHILDLSSETIQTRITDCNKLGFRKSLKMIENTPSILGYKIRTIKNKLKALSKLQFIDPAKLISRFPALLTISKKSVKNKIKWLQKAGFSDPIKLVTKQPQLLGMNQNTLGKKILFFQRVLAKSTATAIELFENFPMTLTMALKRHSLICRYIYSKSLTFSYNLFNKLSAKIKQYITAQTVAEDPKLQHCYNRYYGIA